MAHARYRARAHGLPPVAPSYFPAEVVLLKEDGEVERSLALCQREEDAQLLVKAVNVYLELAAEFNREGTEPEFMEALGLLRDT
jgi:hypothetical protein